MTCQILKKMDIVKKDYMYVKISKLYSFNGRKIIVIININEKNFITTRLLFIIIIFTFYLIFSDVASIVRIIQTMLTVEVKLTIHNNLLNSMQIVGLLFAYNLEH